MRIRHIRHGDSEQLKPLVLRSLEATFAQGGDLLPTERNAIIQLCFALEGAAKGDPCLVAEENGQLIGFLFMREVDFYGSDTRYKTCRSYGSFVLPEYRRRGVGLSLILTAGHLAKCLGYEKLLGMTFGTGHEKRALELAARFPGAKQVGVIYMKNLARTSKEAKTDDSQLDAAATQPVDVLRDARDIQHLPAHAEAVA